MTEPEIFEMASAAGFGESWFEKAEPGYPALPREGMLVRFAQLVAASESEACANICDEVAYERWPNAPILHGANSCAKAIRSRNKNE